MVKIIAIFEFIFSGDSRNITFHITTYRSNLWTFPMNETPVGGREQSFTNDESRSLFMSATF